MKKNFITAYQAPWWLPGRHIQTLWPALFRRYKNGPPLQRERIELPDGDFVDLDWSIKSVGPIVLILHGLEGSIDSSYAKGMMSSLNEAGYRAVFMHFRGCSGEHNRLPRSYHSGDTQDIAYVVELIKTRESGVKIGAVGFSLGANALLKWLGETGTANPLTAAVAISIPFDLEKTVRYLQKGFSRIYEKHLLKQLQRKMSKKFTQMICHLPLTSFFDLKNLIDFDDHVTAPLHGFKSAIDYYSQSSCKPYLKNIAVPTLIIHAKNDPFMPATIIPTMAEVSPNVLLEIMAEGGHVGFLAGRFPWQSYYWTERRVPLFLQNWFN